MLLGLIYNGYSYVCNTSTELNKRENFKIKLHIT